MTHTKTSTSNGVNGRRYVPNGSTVTNQRDTYRSNYNRNTSSNLNPKSKYGAENLVIFLIVGLLGAAGIELAIRTATSTLMMIGQIAGFLASTISICVVKYKMGKGVYIGRQLRYAKGLYTWGVLFESLTLFAKYVPDVVGFYLITVAFTGPALALAMQKIQDMDPDDRLERLKKENKIYAKTLREERMLLVDSIPTKKDLATLRAEDNLQDRRNSMMLSKSKGWVAWWVLNKLARQDMEVVYTKIQSPQQKREVKKLNVSDAKITKETKKRRTKGPRPENAENGIYCKAQGCGNKLGEGQKKYCSKECGNRERQRRLRQKKKLNA